MIPGKTDTECRVAAIRDRELPAEAERQRRAATSVAQADRPDERKTMMGYVCAFMKQAGGVVPGMRSIEAMGHGAAARSLTITL